MLARNDGVLPLPRTRLGRVAVIGPNAELARTLGGGSATVFPPYTISPLDGLRGAGLDVTYAPGTLGHLRTAAARAPWLLRPDGSSSGAEVRFYSASGELAGSQQRDGVAFRWMNGFGLADPAEPITRLEISCVIRATDAGTYQLGVSGLGQARLRLDGAELFDITLTAPEGADVAELLMAPPQHLAPVELAAGQSARVLLEHDVASSPMADFGTFLQLDLAAPHGTTMRRSRRRLSWRPPATWPWSWSAPPPRWKARASTVPRSRCPGARTNWSAGWPRPTRGPWSWSTPAPPSCCPGPATWPRCC